MSVYFVKGKGWRYDFTLNEQRYTEAWFPRKKAAQSAEAEKRKEVMESRNRNRDQVPTDMAFLELANRRLDYLKAYNSHRHYMDHKYMARRWVERWAELGAREITQELIEGFLLERSKRSPDTANKELRCLRALFNFAKKRKWISENPCDGISMLPVEKRIKYVPPPEDVEKVIAVADLETQDYLRAIQDTVARMGEINRLTWDDVDFKNKCLILYTRKKKGGHLSPRRIPMTDRLFQILSRRYALRDPAKPWVFWHTYWSSKTGERCEGPYKDRKKIMKVLCDKAGVRYFRFHALRHCGASLMERHNVSIGTIQRLLGHENRMTTEIYLHSLGNPEREAVRILERAESLTQSLTQQTSPPAAMAVSY